LNTGFITYMSLKEILYLINPLFDKRIIKFTNTRLIISSTGEGMSTNFFNYYLLHSVNANIQK